MGLRYQMPDIRSLEFEVRRLEANVSSSLSLPIERFKLLHPRGYLEKYSFT